ncbi:MAG: 3-hydroxyacyl-CoA dehydrogenase NAD-binding domain-containing protein [Gammaproteobacteria bacterium]|nr:3-hydroxyacyl-CoA dehydrogenase NAD-binding domain-containing protein [Gammaproteobacteria bacterium]
MGDAITDWFTHTDDLGILWLTLNQKDTDTNVLSSAVLDQLNLLLDQIVKDTPEAVIICSGKSSGFIAGADVKEFLTVTNKQEALIMIKRGQNVFSRIESLPCPTVAMIEGFCMGGGTELALACDYRIALDSASTKIGLPEVKLGIHPAFGGLVRSTEIINPIQSLELMLSGRSLAVKPAKAMGLIDQIQPQRQIRRAAQQMALKKPAQQAMPLVGKLLSLPGVRTLLSAYMKKQVAQKAPKQHYPAPYALLDVWSQYYGNRKRLMEEEANSVARLIQGDTVRNLIRVFFLQTQLKSQGSKETFTPQHVHVIGAGVMGGDIASWCALRGFTVTLQDREPRYLSNAMANANKLFSRKIRTKHERNAALDRLIPDCKGYGVEKADVVIEAIFENKEAKQEIYRDIEPRMKPDAILATNTSSITLEDLSTALNQPERLVGIHFFNPVAMMPLVEIVKTRQSSKVVIDKALAFTLHIGKLPLVVKSSPGFLVNRILMPYLVEAIFLFDEGIAPEAIDEAALNFGMPMGPVELADTVGLDICHSVAENLSQAYDISVPAGLEKFVKANKLGKKTGSGFYQYTKGKAAKNRDADLGDQKMIQNRLLFRLLNEAAICLDEKIVDNSDLLDAGIIFGTGFAPFRGGPLNHSRQQGVDALINTMEEYGKKYGERFSPAKGWALVKE